MSAVYISVAVTRERERPPVTHEDAVALLEPFRDKIAAQRATIDPSGEFSAVEHGGSEVDAIDALLSSLANGLTWIHSEDQADLAHQIGDTAFELIVDGDQSWGDPLFDVAEDVVRVGQVVEYLPALGRAVGVLGLGIRLGYWPEAPVDSDDRRYEKCAQCHLFIELNPDHFDIDSNPVAGIAMFEHLHRGDAADEAIVSTHEATPSGQIHTISEWQSIGPAKMRARFTSQPAPTADPYPEHTKLAAVQARSQAIGEFLEEGSYTLAEYREIEGDRDPRLVPVQTSIQEVLADHFEIDLRKIEAEKRAMLDNLRG